MSDEPWEVQRKLKYRDHDVALEDISVRDADLIRGAASKNFIETRESDNVRLIIGAFMSYLTSKGYRIVSKDNQFPGYRKAGEES